MIINFDTNAYRDLVPQGKTMSDVRQIASDLLRREGSAGHVAFLSPHVVVELANNLLQPVGSKAHDECLNAIVLAALHAQQPVAASAKLRIRFLADTESQWCNALFGVSPPDHDASSENLARLCAVLEGDPETLKTNASVQALVRDIAQQHSRAERFFLDDFLRAIQEIDPSATEPRLFASDDVKRTKFLRWLRSQKAHVWMASSFVSRFADLVGQNLTPAELSAIGSSVMPDMKLALAFLQETWERVVNAALDPTDPDGAFRNNLVDYHLLLTVSPGANQNGPRCLLVSTEKKMLRAGGALPASSCVLSLNDYLSSLPV